MLCWTLSTSARTGEIRAGGGEISLTDFNHLKITTVGKNCARCETVEMNAACQGFDECKCGKFGWFCDHKVDKKKR